MRATTPIASNWRLFKLNGDQRRNRTAARNARNYEQKRDSNYSKAHSAKKQKSFQCDSFFNSLLQPADSHPVESQPA